MAKFRHLFWQKYEDKERLNWNKNWRYLKSHGEKYFCLILSSKSKIILILDISCAKNSLVKVKILNGAPVSSVTGNNYRANSSSVFGHNKASYLWPPSNHVLINCFPVTKLHKLFWHFDKDLLIKIWPYGLEKWIRPPMSSILWAYVRTKGHIFYRIYLMLIFVIWLRKNKRKVENNFKKGWVGTCKNSTLVIWNLSSSCMILDWAF